MIAPENRPRLKDLAQKRINEWEVIRARIGDESATNATRGSATNATRGDVRRCRELMAELELIGALIILAKRPALDSPEKNSG